VALTPSNPVVLTPPGTATNTCTIDFAFDVLKVSTMPAQPSPPNTVTTGQIGFVTGTAAVDHVTGPRASTGTNPAGLTARVVEVVLLANGLTNSRDCRATRPSSREATITTFRPSSQSWR
jgi:hypothetical protein